MAASGMPAAEAVEHIAGMAFRRATRHTPAACRAYAERTVARDQARTQGGLEP